MSLLTKSNVREHCRTCLKRLNGSTENTTSGYNIDEGQDSKNLCFNISNDPELQHLICINVDESNTSNTLYPALDNFPENICLGCYNKLYSFAQFRRRAKQSAEKLHTVLNCSGDIKLELNYEEWENELKRVESVGTAVRECKFQLHDATAETEETFFDTSVADLADVEMNDDPFSTSAPLPPTSPLAPSISDCSDRDFAPDDFTVDDEIEVKKNVKKKVVEKNVAKKEVTKKEVAKEEVTKKVVEKKGRARKPKSPKVINKLYTYRCPQCDEDFGKNSELTDHVNQVHALGSTPFLCDHCDKSYRNLRSLKDHVVLSHQDKIKEQEHFQCTQCPKAYLDESALKKHQDLHFSQKKTHICGICSEQFPVKRWLIEHLRTHTPDGKIPCALCNKTYSAIQDLENHLRSAHLKQKPHHCQICDKFFQNKQSFRIHNYRHSGKKPHLCDICGRDFRQRTAMKTHRSTHFKDDLSQF